MANKKKLPKDKEIKREIKRLQAVFEDLDENMKSTVKGLIETAAFLRVSLEELQDSINKNGYIVEYQNGEYQKGTKQSDEVKTHISMTKNYTAIIKQLCDLVPPAARKNTRLDAFRDA